MATIGLNLSRTGAYLPTNLNSQHDHDGRRRTMVGMNSAEEELGRSMKLHCGINKFSNRLLRLRAAVEGDDETSQFPDFVAYEAIYPQEYLVAASLRAECHYEGRRLDKDTQVLKWLFTERDFLALNERRLEAPNNCKSILMLNMEDIRNGHPCPRVAGAMELNIRYFAHGQRFPQEYHVDGPPRLRVADIRPSNSFMMISNMCVKKQERRRGLGTLMVQCAISIAKQRGIKKVFLRVEYDNEAALKLYEKNGFKIVEEEDCYSEVYAGEQWLMCFESDA